MGGEDSSTPRLRKRGGISKVVKNPSRVKAVAKKRSSFNMSLAKAILDDLERSPALSHDNRTKLAAELGRLPDEPPFTRADNSKLPRRARGRPRKGLSFTSWLIAARSAQRREVAAEYYIAICQGGRGLSADAVDKVKSWYMKEFGREISETSIKTAATDFKNSGKPIRPSTYFEMASSQTEIESERSRGSFFSREAVAHRLPSEASQNQPGSLDLPSIAEPEDDPMDLLPDKILRDEFHMVARAHLFAASRKSAAYAAEQVINKIEKDLQNFAEYSVLAPERTRWMSNEERKEFRSRFLDDFILEFAQKLASNFSSQPS